MVSLEEIEKNEFNLNLPRYIDSQTLRTCRTSKATSRAASRQLMWRRSSRYWDVCPELKAGALQTHPPRLFCLAVEKSAIKTTIYEHPEFVDFVAGMNTHFAVWRRKNSVMLKALKSGCHPKEIIAGSQRTCLPTMQASR